MHTCTRGPHPRKAKTKGRVEDEDDDEDEDDRGRGAAQNCVEPPRPFAIMNTEPQHGRPTRLAGRASDWRLQAALGLVAIALAVVVGVAVGRRWPRRIEAPRPAQPLALPQANPIWDSWRAARSGDVDAYLACFEGPARKELDEEVRRVGREAYRVKLLATAEAALGVTLGPPKPAPGGGLCFPVTVEHAGESELLDYTVARAEGGWRIRAVVPRGRGAAPPYAERLGPPAQQGGRK